MRGHVDDEGRALISITVYSLDESQAIPTEVWIDTGFTGELVLPREEIENLSLEKVDSIDAILAEGSKVQLDIFDCSVDWFGDRVAIEVMSTESKMALIGVGMLRGTELLVNFSLGTVSLKMA